MTKIIAEIGQNHMGDCKVLTAMVKQLIDSKVDIVKFQYWDVDRIYAKNDSRYAAAKGRELTIESIKQNAEKVTKANKVAMVSYFGIEPDLKWHTENKVMIKYASSEVDTVNAQYHNQKGNLPGVISLGYSNQLVQGNYIYMACNPSYPDYNPGLALTKMVNIKNSGFACGFSDHSVGIDAVKAAIMLGADMVEKHFTTETLQKESKFRDHIGSMTIADLDKLLLFRDAYTTMRDDPDFIRKIDGKRRLKV